MHRTAGAAATDIRIQFWRKRNESLCRFLRSSSRFHKIQSNPASPSRDGSSTCADAAVAAYAATRCAAREQIITQTTAHP